MDLNSGRVMETDRKGQNIKIIKTWLDMGDERGKIKMAYSYWMVLLTGTGSTSLERYMSMRCPERYRGKVWKLKPTV
jgi:hypothetical protein